MSSPSNPKNLGKSAKFGRTIPLAEFYQICDKYCKGDISTTFNSAMESYNYLDERRKITEKARERRNANLEHNAELREARCQRNEKRIEQYVLKQVRKRGCSCLQNSKPKCQHPESHRKEHEFFVKTIVRYQP